MDPLGRLLDASHARGAFVLRSSFTAPWAIRIEDGAPLTLVAVVRGRACISGDVGDRSTLGPGDLAVVRGPQFYTIGDEPDRAAQVMIDAEQNCHSLGPDGVSIGPQGTRFWGNAADGETIMLTGTYRSRPEVSKHLLAALPPILVLPGAQWTNPLIDYLAQESERDEPGQDAVLDRLLDLLLIAVLRGWLARPDSGAPGWYRANQDPLVGHALALIHDRPAEQWTVASLAASAGTSRANLARRFRDLVGESPITYLTTWRLNLAADLLVETDATVASVARQVGYGDAFALSTAFKRVRGVSPRQFRNEVPADRGVFAG